MYNAFLLDHGDQLQYRLFTGDGAGDGAGAATAVGEQQDPPSCRPSCFTLSRRFIHILNIAAALVHAILFVSIFFLASGKDKQSWNLKQDRTQVVLSSAAAGSNAFLSTSGGAVCQMAKPNVLNFTRTERGAMQAWAYPQDAGISLDLATLVLIFFFLSFAFQIAVTIASAVGNHGYTSIFSREYEMEDSSAGEKSYHAVFEAKEEDAEAGSDEDKFRHWCYAMLAFNWLRFIEYSISGSVVLVTIALVAGIADFELLLCIFVLSAACMLMGLGSEFALRGSNAIKPLLLEESGVPSNVKDILAIIRSQMKAAFWLLHIFAWVCILIPWYVIYVHYRGWWEPCKYPAAPPSDATPQPPDFVKAIVFVQAFLFLLFGVVQFVQFFYPHKRRAAEVTYIVLSLTAKVMLGSILAANILLV